MCAPCAAGVKKLDMQLPGDDRRQCVSVGIFSPDGEYLPFTGPIVTEGRPEEWLNRVEDAMFATTKKHLYKVLEDSKGEARGDGRGGGTGAACYGPSKDLAMPSRQAF